MGSCKKDQFLRIIKDTVNKLKIIYEIEGYNLKPCDGHVNLYGMAQQLGVLQKRYDIIRAGASSNSVNVTFLIRGYF